MLDNFFEIVYLSDSYKVTHWPQYRRGTTNVYSYFESRGGKSKDTVFFGLQYLLKRYLAGTVVTRAMVNEAFEVYSAHFGNNQLFYLSGWEHIVTHHGGRLPLSIKAVPEGTVVPVSNVLMTVENTCPECYWLTNFMETLLVQTWYGTSVATQSRNIKKNIMKWLDQTGDPSLIDFKLHDFGFRGVSSVESAAIGGAAHLVNFKGTDTVVALRLLQKFYGATQAAGFSIPAAEHSTITSWGRAHEVNAYLNMLEKFPRGLVAIVADSYDIRKAVSEHFGEQLRQRVLERDGVVVIRPDSGYPRDVVLDVTERLGEAFGYEENAKGYKVLNPKVRIIQGDGVNQDSIDDILLGLAAKKWSADNIAFGMGGALLQKLDRDTHKFAFKCSSTVCDGVQRDVFKDPVTDSGKRSKAGRLALVQSNDGEYVTAPEELAHYAVNELVPVFRDGELLVDQSLGDIRQRAAV